MRSKHLAISWLICACLVVAASRANSEVQSPALTAQHAVELAIETAKKRPSSDFDTILQQVRTVLLSVQKQLKTSQLPPLKSVDISLQTGITQTVGGQITIFVITIGGQTSDVTTQTMKFTLTPPTATGAAIEDAIASAPPNFSAQFSAAIVAAAVAADNALSNEPEPKLGLDTFTADIKFTVENTLQGGVNTLTLLPINLQVNGKVTPTNTHEAVLTFAKPKPAGGDHP
jgi:Trypsin-co-occurring domain 2